ncbi:hypothetical protein DSO57_1020241 [Entomophthora muscae]|uniref:Uncharacterized protein n=1 Tax=Entomophthora muscae TaxID=34485 RepID=A0ACC2TF16_9FUNG|nr:hypothetical protein DSO57_1020241 [Entomophthora muscae]
MSRKNNRSTIPPSINSDLPGFVVNDDVVEYSSDEAKKGRDSSDEESYFVERILAHKKQADGYMYHIKWKNWSIEDATWEHESNMSCPDILKQYWEKVAAKKVAKDSEEKLRKKNRVLLKKERNLERKRKDDLDEASEPDTALIKIDYPPPDLVDWNSSVDKVFRLVQNENALWAILQWKEGHLTCHPIEVVSSKCPQQVTFSSDFL